jgi:type IV secretory pathway VirB10-like protein
MRNLRLISTTAAILLLGASAVSAQSMKSDETPASAPAAQQNAPAEKMAPALKSEQRKAPETTGQSDKKGLKSQMMDKDAPAVAVGKASSDANGSANVKNKNRAAEGKRGTTAQASADEGAVGGPNRVSHRHYRHYYSHCWTNIFGYRHCWR